jgi:hypothetical protein
MIMKKLLILPALLIASIAFSQLGIKGGVNISNFSGDFPDNIEKSSLTTFHFGGLWKFNFGALALQPEVVFSEQGAKLEKAGVETNFKVSYVNIPVMLQWQTDGGFYLEGGPQAGFKVSESLPDSIQSDLAKSGDFSIGLGLGFNRGGGLGIGARYNVGISQIGEFDSDDISPDYKNAVVQISLFYMLGSRKAKKQAAASGTPPQ